MVSKRSQNPVVRASKFMSLVLRHQPEKIGLKLDEGGWADFEELVEKSPNWMTRQLIQQAIRENNKQRFAVSPDGKRIRASQGHSIKVNLGYEPTEPPEYLYHGSYPKVLEAIKREGLKKMERHHVHLSPDPQTAHTVGLRRGGRPVMFTIQAGRMFRDGYQFFVSENGVWLTDHVPPEYLGNG